MIALYMVAGLNAETRKLGAEVELYGIGGTGSIKATRSPACPRAQPIEAPHIPAPAITTS